MFITPAYAQAGAGGPSDVIFGMLPFILIFVIMYFFILRPQRQKMKMHQEMVNNVRRGDTVVMSGGMIGKVSKVVDDSEIQIELAKDVKVRAFRPMIHEVRSKGEPVSSE